MHRPHAFAPFACSTWRDRGRAASGRLAPLFLALLLALFTVPAHADDTAPVGSPGSEDAIEENAGPREETPPPDEESAGDPEPASEDAGEPPDDDEVEQTGIAKINPLKVHWDAGLHVEGKWDNLHVRIGGDLQNDTAGFINTQSAEDYLATEIQGGVQWRRARAYAEGRLFHHLDFKLRYDFTAGNPPNLKDAYFSFVNLPIPTAGFTVGRFKAPLGLDGFTGADDLVFMERSLLSEAFLPSRNTGFMLHGDSPQHRVRWSFSVLQPEAEDIALSDSDNLGWSARLAYAFTEGTGGRNLIHLGADFWRRNVSDTIQYASRPESHIAPFFVDTGKLPAESSDTVVIESAMQRGRVTFQGEFALSRVNHSGGDSLMFHGLYAQASWYLTGEKAPYRTERGTFTRPHPKRSIRQGGTGAMEVGFRFSRVVLDDREFKGGTLNDWSAGFNWYPTYHLKIMFNAILADLKGAKPVGILQMRLQVAY